MSSSATRAKPVSLWGQLWRLLVGLGVGAIACFFALRGTDLHGVQVLLGGVSAAWVAAGLATVVLTQLIKGFRWQLVLGGRASLPFGPTMSGLLVGQALNLLLPFRAGDFVRAHLVGQRIPEGSVFAFYTVIVEKALDAAMLLVFLMVLLAWGPWPGWLSITGILISILTLLIVVGGLAGAAAWRARQGQRPQKTWVSWLLVPASDLAASLAAALHDGRLLGMLLLSAVIWGLGAATNWAVFAALGLSAHWSAALLILVGIYAGVAIPAPPARIGLFHYIVVLSLAVYGIGQTEALAYGVLLHLVVVVPLLLGGAVAALTKT